MQAKSFRNLYATPRQAIEIERTWILAWASAGLQLGRALPLGLARILRALGKSATIWNLHPTPPVYRQLPGADSIHVGAEPPAGFPDAFDAAFVLECPTLDRTGLEQRLPELALLNVDHHLGNSHWGEVNWVDPGAPAVGVMVAELARKLGVRPDPDACDCLLLALVTDTGGFRFANATPAAFNRASSGRFASMSPAG